MLFILQKLGSSQKFAHRGQTKELSYGTLPPPPVLKRKCDRQWEKCMADLLQRSSLTTYKGVHQTLVIDRRFRFPMKSSLFHTTCSNNVVYLTHAGVLPWRFSVHFEKKNKETILNSRRRIRFLLFFLFLWMLTGKSGWPVYIYWVSNWSEINLAFKSAIDICRSTASDACIFRLREKATSTLNTFFEI